MDECKLLENGREIMTGTYSDCMKLLEEKAQQDKERMMEAGNICEIKQGLDYYSRVDVTHGDAWYFLSIFTTAQIDSFMKMEAK